MEDPSPTLPADPRQRLTVIEPRHRLSWPDLGELWKYRELIGFLVWRDVKVRYKQTMIGASWAIIQPFLTMVLFTLFFGKWLQMPTDGLPAPVFYYAGLLPWTLFATGVTAGSNSLVGNHALVTKVYFPRLVIPLAAATAPLVDFVVAFTVLAGMMIWFSVPLSPALLLLPVCIVLLYLTAVAFCLWLSALNVRYRDVRHTIPFIVQFLMFASPVIYPTSMLDLKGRLIYGLNPIAGVIETFRWAVTGKGVPPGPLMLVSCCVLAIALVTGMIYFRHMEDTFADVI